MNEELYNHNLIGTEVPLNAPTPWVRNPEWLAMPTVLPTENKIVILFRVNNDNGNYFGIQATVTGGFSVDWGDGTNGNFATNTTASKQFDYASTPGTPTTDGYKQVLITITPTGANPFTDINLAVRNATAGLGSYVQGHLDVIVSAPNATTMTIGSQSIVTGTTPLMQNLERVQILSSAITACNGLFGNLTALRSYSVSSSAVITFLGNMFIDCHALEEVGPLPYSTATTTASMFLRCRSLKSLGVNSITTAATDLTAMFSECRLLQSVPPIILTSASVNGSSMFSYCSSLLVFPQLSWEKINSLSNTFFNCYSLKKVPALNLPLCSTLASTFQNCYGLKEVGTLTTTTALTSLSTTFSNCYNLVALPNITVTSAVNTFVSFATNCAEITTIPSYDSSSNTTFASAFSTCVNLTSAPTFNYTKCTTASGMFTSCPKLEKIGAIDFGTTTTGVITLSNMFQAANSYDSGLREIGLVSIPSTASSSALGQMFNNQNKLRAVNINCTKVASTTNVSSIFAGAGSLGSVILTGLRYGGFTIAGTMDTTALIALFNSIGTAAGAQTLTVSTNPGWASLTAGDKAIATGKGWTLA